MNNFDYYAPTKVVFGKDTEKETGRLVKEQGASSVLVHFGGKSAIASGLLDRVCQSLKEEDTWRSCSKSTSVKGKRGHCTVQGKED